jgi:DNA-binding NtrC family response regulator
MRILVVDDEEDIRESLKFCLEVSLGRPVEVDTAADGEEARAMLLAGPDYDLVLTDERMPRMGGTDLLAWMRVHVPGAQRVLMSAYGRASLLRDATERADIALFIAKPFRLDRDLASLRAMLEDPGSGGLVAQL